MRKLTRLTINVSPALVLAGILAGSFPACDSGGDGDSTLPETTGSGGQNTANNASNINNSSVTGFFTNGAGGETSGSSNTGEGGSGAGECGGDAVNAEPVQVNLLLVIDRSGSMTATPEGFDDD